MPQAAFQWPAAGPIPPGLTIDTVADSVGMAGQADSPELIFDTDACPTPPPTPQDLTQTRGFALPAA